MRKIRAYRLGLAHAVLLTASALMASPAPASDFVSMGPAPVQGQGGNSYNTYSGAVTDIVVDPTNSNTMYVGTNNGGVWVTHDGGNTWTPTGDKQISLSIDSLTADPTDPSNKTLIAGTGLLSNGYIAVDPANQYSSSGGLQAGLLYSKDGGATWTQLGGTTLSGQSVDGVAARGNTIVAGTYERAQGTYTGGLYRSTDGGTTFTLISGSGGLPAGPVSALVGDPTNSAKLYAAVTAPNTAGRDSTAIYVSNDTGATWTEVFGSANAGGAIDATDHTEIRMATGPGGTIAAGLINVATGKVKGIYYSSDGGATWKSLSVPGNLNTGGQAKTNFTLAIDPNNTNYVYIAGDSTSNAPYVLTAYRVDVASNTATKMYLANTGDGSSVHPDSRSMAFDASGNLIVSTDGGIYTRTLPQSDSGVWHSLTGNLSAIETYQAVYGANSHLIAVAAQDNSTSLESANGSVKYNETFGGDGTIATVNDTTLAGKSVYYLSVQNLVGSSQRLVVDSSGTILDTQNLTFNVNPNPGNAEFTVPFVLNKIDPSLIAIGGNYVYLTQDTMTGGNAPGSADVLLDLTQLGGDGNGTSAIAYGTKDNTNALIASVGGTIWMSTSTAGGISALPAYTGLTPMSLAFDTRTQQRFFAADDTNLWGTTDQGAHFTNLTANLPSGLIRPSAVEFVDNNGVDALVVGGLDNAANIQSTIATADSSTTGLLSDWRFLGTDLPNSQVSELVYNPLADVLTVSTFGRGVWLMYDFTSNYATASVLQFGLAGNDSTPDVSLLTGNRPLIKYGNGTLLITGDATYTGGTTIDAGTLQLGNGGTSGSILGDIANNGALIFDRSNALTFGGVISGSGSVTQAGSGTLTLTGNSTYSGATSVNAGTLSVNGSIATSSGVTVNSGGTLGGTGTLPSTTVLNGGTIAAGNSIGTLHLNGNLTLSSGSTVDAQISSTSADEIIATGTAAIQGHLIVTSTSPNYNAGTLYTIINSAGALSGTFGDIVFNGSFGSTAPTVSYDGHDVFLKLSELAEIGWSATPGTSDWNTGANWATGTIPTAIDTASFGQSTKTGIDIQKANTSVSEMLFHAGAPAYTFNVTGTASGASSLVIGGTGIVDQSGNAPSFVVSGVSGGPGTLEFDNSATPGDATITANAFGTVLFTGMSNAPSATLVTGDGGTVDISNLLSTGLTAGSIAGSGSFLLGAKTLTTGGLNSSTTVSGAISGAGALQKIGTGTLTLTGTNTYTGGTTIGGGVLQLGNGGTSGSLIGDIVDNAQFVLDRSDTLSYGGVISGTGGVAQAGSGTTILTGTSTYTGATTVTAGILQVDGSIAASSGITVNAGATLQGSGTVGPAAVSGTISPGAGAGSFGTLSVLGNATLNSGANLAIDAGPGVIDALSVTGALAVNGSVTFKFVSAPQYNDSGVFAIAGKVTGAFASVPDTIAGVLYPSVSIVNTATGQELVMTVKAGSFLDQLTSPSKDEIAVATALDQARAANYGDLKALYQSVDPLSDGSLTSALDNLVPNAERALPGLSTLQVDSFTGMVWQHLNALLNGGSGADGVAFQVNTKGLMLAQSGALAISGPNSSASLGLQAGAAPMVQPLAPMAVTPAQGGDMDMFGNKIGGFLNGSSLSGSVAAGPAGAHAGVNGYLVSGGIDLQPNSNFVVGASIAYSQTTAKMNLIPENTKSNTFQGVAYGLYELGDGWSIDGFAGSGSQSITTNRTVTTGASTYALHGNTSGTSPTAGAAVGYEMVTQNVTITPSAGLQWLDASIDGYTETGGPGAMTFGNISRRSFTGRIGFDAIGSFKIGSATVEPLVDSYLVHDFDSGSGSLTAAFAAAPASVMTFGLPRRTDTWLEFALGAQTAVDDNVTLGIRYDGMAGRSDIHDHAWTGQVLVRF